MKVFEISYQGLQNRFFRLLSRSNNKFGLKTFKLYVETILSSGLDKKSMKSVQLMKNQQES